MDAQTLRQLERIAAAGIRLLPAPQVPRHLAFEREGCALLVEWRGDSFGGVGSPGRITEKGFAALVERGGRPCFVFKDDVTPATADQAASARLLLRDFLSAIQPG
jgi:hypothetical protein